MIFKRWIAKFTRSRAALTSFFMAFSMSGMMSLFILLITKGPDKQFFAIWLNSWALAFPIAWLIAFLMAIPVQKLVSRIINR